MNRLTDWIKRHQVAAFFVIIFAITWGLGFSYSAVLQRGQLLLVPLAMVATCGPALAGIIVAAVSDTQPRRGTRKAVLIAFFVAWVVSALVFSIHNTVINHAPLSPVVIGLYFVVVVPVAFVISMAYSRIPAVRNYMSSLIRLRGVWGWAILALVLFPFLVLLPIPVSHAIGRQPIDPSGIPGTGLTLVGLIAAKFFYQLFFFNATGEEVGWRGFALPRLQTRTSPLVAALIIAVFWAPWHFFLWQAEGNPVLTLQYWIDRYTGMILFSLFIVWICNRANGSILVAGIAHAAVNTAEAFMAAYDRQVSLLLGFITVMVMILVDRMWKKLPPDHPAVYSSPQLSAQPGVEPTPTPAL
jgi:membrane protease YdiL (CAAX protease family)